MLSGVDGIGKRYFQLSDLDECFGDFFRYAVRPSAAPARHLAFGKQGTVNHQPRIHPATIENICSGLITPRQAKAKPGPSRQTGEPPRRAVAGRAYAAVGRVASGNNSRRGSTRPAEARPLPTLRGFHQVRHLDGDDPGRPVWAVEERPRHYVKSGHRVAARLGPEVPAED